MGPPFPAELLSHRYRRRLAAVLQAIHRDVNHGLADLPPDAKNPYV